MTAGLLAWRVSSRGKGEKDDVKAGGRPKQELLNREGGGKQGSSRDQEGRGKKHCWVDPKQGLYNLNSYDSKKREKG